MYIHSNKKPVNPKIYRQWIHNNLAPDCSLIEYKVTDVLKRFRIYPSYSRYILFYKTAPKHLCFRPHYNNRISSMNSTLTCYT